MSDTQAVAVVRGVRRALNEFRDTRRDDLVRLRNHLRATTTLTNVVTFLVLAVAVRSAITDTKFYSPLSDPFVAATAFYFVGALVGLLDQLYRESRINSATEDYGLFDARLTLTPVLSGLAAVGGVLLGAMLLSTVGMSAVIPGGLTLDTDVGSAVVAPRPPASGPAVAPSPQAGVQEPKGVSAAAAPSGTMYAGTNTSGAYQTRHPARPSLADVFSLGTYAFGLVVAAIFGLTPRLFIDRLRSESRAYIRDLQETSPGQSTASVSV